MVARVDDLQRVGDFVPVTVLDEPVVITHGLDGELRAFYNVCRHRAGQVALTKGNRKSLQCRYHGWTYGLDGCLRAAPEMEATEGFAKEDFGLVPVRVEKWGPFVFVNLSESAPPLADVMGAIPAEVARPGYDVESMRLVERREYVIECNWKVYVDNYLEGYHIPIVHPTLFKELDFAQYRVEPRRWTTLQHAPLRPAEPGRHYQPTADDTDARYWWVFPNLMLNAYQGQLQTNVIVPLDSEHTVTLFDWFAPDAKPPAGFDQLVQFSDDIQREDIWICEAVQKNLHSTAWTPGRYCAKHESSLHHFHRLLRESLAEGAGF
jgi:choline monooxygenase